AAYQDRSAMHFDNLFCYGQTQSGSARFGCEERLENLIKVGPANSDSRNRNLHDPERFPRPSPFVSTPLNHPANPIHSPALYRLRRIDDDIREDLNEHIAVEQQHRQTVSKLSLYSDLRLKLLTLNHMAQRLFKYLIYIGRL